MTELTTRQSDILEIAEHIIATDGIFSLTIRNIAKAAGISEPAVYRHFDSKSEVLMGILRQFEQTTLKLFDKIPDDMPSIKVLEEVFKDRLNELSHDSASTAIIFAGDYLRSEPEIAEELSRIIESHRIKLESIVKDGQEKGELRNDIPADHICALIMGTLRMTVRKCYDSGKKDDLIKRGIKLFKSIKTLITSKEVN